MDTGVFLSALCLLCAGASAASAAEGLAEPQDVHFHSVNLRNVLRWRPADGSPHDTVYTVEYAIYGDAVDGVSEQVRWRRVGLCSSISQTECDLSKKTSDLEHEYYARVRAASGQVQSVWSESVDRFRPLSDTVLGAPLVEVSVAHNYINISIKGPFRWRTGRPLGDIFPHLIYNVSVFNSRTNHTDIFYVKSGNLTLGPLEFSTRFCVVVQTQSDTIPMDSRPSGARCVETPKDPFRDQLLAAVLGGVLPSALCLCVLAVLGGLVHCYVTDHRQKLPKSAHVAPMKEKLHTFQPEIPSTIIINLIKTGLCEKGSAGLRAALPELVSELEPVSAEPPVSYAQQRVQAPVGSEPRSAGAEDEDSVSVDSDEPEPWPEEPDHSEAGDYAVVVSAAFVAPGQSEAEVSPYRTQDAAIDPRDTCEDERSDEEEAQTFLDWSPESGELKIPLMGLLGPGDEAPPEERFLLPNVILRQASEDSCEQEDGFTRMERDWGLIIHSGPE